MRFDGKRALITGAGKGIGRTTATLLAARGAAVVALSRTREDLDSLAAETGCVTIVLDLADAEATRAAARAAQPIDLLVNCAGIAPVESFLDTSVETFDLTMAVNLRAAMILAQETARDLIRRGARGAIVNVSSIAAAVGTTNHAAYCASKAGLDAMTRVMAKELGPFGIRANCVNPGITLTPMAQRIWSEPSKSGPMLARTPLGRFAQPEDVAEAILWLLSDEAAMVHGVCLDVDGGFRAA
ncbi:MAG: SDR family oxidoreductase [Rhodospirillaceae bacterium]|nr:SDR family oxidoreductase [Rhodospirillaceae bacterium]